MKTLTVNDVLALGPCEGYTRERVEMLWGGRKRLSLGEILDLDIPPYDLTWFVVQPGVLPEQARIELLCDFAEHVLPIWERAQPGDSRPRDCIEVVRRHARGEATADELAKVQFLKVHFYIGAAFTLSTPDDAWLAVHSTKHAIDAAAGDRWSAWAAGAVAAEAAEAAGSAGAADDEHRWQLERAREMVLMTGE